MNHTSRGRRKAFHCIFCAWRGFSSFNLPERPLQQSFLLLMGAFCCCETDWGSHPPCGIRTSLPSNFFLCKQLSTFYVLFCLSLECGLTVVQAGLKMVSWVYGPWSSSYLCPLSDSAQVQQVRISKSPSG